MCNFWATKASLTVQPWFFFALSHFSPSLLAPEAFCCPELLEHTALDNPGKQLAATSGDLAGSSCLTSVAGPLRLNKAPDRGEKEAHLSDSVMRFSLYFIVGDLCLIT